MWAVLFFALRSREIPLWKAGRVLAAIAVTLGVVLVALANFMPGFPSLGKLDDLLVFNDDWGTYRGTAWRISWSAWTAQPFWRKLLGVGPGMMHTAVAQWAGADITARMKTFYAAHNEYLELLLTSGVLGLAAWVWFVAAHLRKAAQNWLRPGVAPGHAGAGQLPGPRGGVYPCVDDLPRDHAAVRAFAGVLPAAGR